MPQPSTLTEDLIRSLCSIVRDGNFRTVAYQRMGIPEGTWKTWIHTGYRYVREVEEGTREDYGLQGKLVIALAKAEAECHEELIVDVLEHGTPELKMKFLRLRYNKLYNNNPNAKDDETGETIKRDVGDILAEKLANFIED